MTTYTLHREDTGEHLDAYQIRDRIDRLDSVAEDAPVEIEPWVAKTPAAITPAPTCGMCGGPETGRTDPTRRVTDEGLPARSWARMSGARSWPQIPHDALTAYGRMEAEYDSAHHQIQDLRDLAFWAETEQRKIVSRISDDYWTRRAALEDRYDREITRLCADNDMSSYAAYVQALPDYVRGNSATVAAERHDTVYAELAPDRIHADALIEPDPKPDPTATSALDRLAQQERLVALEAAHDGPAYLPSVDRINEGETPKAIDPGAGVKGNANSADRTGLDKLAARVLTALTAPTSGGDGAGEPTTQVGASVATSNGTDEKLEAETETAVHTPAQSEPWWRRHSETLIGIGVAVLWGAAMAALVVLA